jgi:hypothetical protein
MAEVAKGTFEVELTPGPAELGGAAARFDLAKTFVPGSGEGELAGIAGKLDLTIEDDGTHRYALEYELR